jgi:hypothetical protein
MTGGFDDSGNGNAGMPVVFGGKLYVGTENWSTGGQLWVSQNGTQWTPVFQNGLGHPNNLSANGLLVYRERLYVLFYNDETGLEVWRSSDGQAWLQIGPDGLGDSGNPMVSGFAGSAVFKDRLYLGTGKWDDKLGKVWRLVEKSTYLPLTVRQ